MSRLMIFIHKIKETILDDAFTAKHRTKASYFTRCTAKITQGKLITFLLTLPRQSTQIAINRFIKEKEYEFTLDKQGLFEAREKLSHTAFIDLNNNYFLRDYAYGADFKTFSGFRIIAVDGCVFDAQLEQTRLEPTKQTLHPPPKYKAQHLWIF